MRQEDFEKIDKDVDHVMTGVTIAGIITLLFLTLIIAYFYWRPYS